MAILFQTLTNMKQSKKSNLWLHEFQYKLVESEGDIYYNPFERRLVMSIGSRIQELRIFNGLTQEQLAEKLGVSRQSVSKWEMEQSLPEIEKVEKVSLVTLKLSML